MLTTLLNKIKSVWEKIAPFLVVILAAVFMLEKHEKDGDEAKLINADIKAKDDALKAQGAALAVDSAKVETDAQKEKAQPQTEQQMVDFLNKNDV